MKKVNKIEPTMPVAPVRKKVAAYARVSAETDRTMHSLSAQISFYSNLIQSNPRWQYVGVYADSFISGTEIETRPEFKRMLEDCEQGKIDIILSKSISRFARNTVDLLETVRHLKELGIEVQFEKEHINSLSEDGELMLTLLASFAEEEVRSLSENVRWAVRKKFENGRPNSYCLYGYRWNGEKFIVEPEEAKIVKLIYQNFLDGLSAEQTEKQLEEMGVTSYTGQHFSNSSIRAILKNEKYTGNMLLQKEYTVSHITHKSKKNEGELPMYWVENSHEAIIPLETYQKVQDEIKRRRELGALANWSINTNHFTSKIKCGICGSSFVKSTRKNRAKTSGLGEHYIFYGCATNKNKGGHCPCGTIRESILEQECAKVLGLEEFDPDVFSEQIKQITFPKRGILIFEFYDGHIVEHHWSHNAKKESWTPERRKSWGKLHMGNNNNPWKNPFTGYIHCPVCGGNFRRQAHKYADGTDATYWHCGNDSTCSNKCKIPETLLKSIICEVLGLPEFDEAIFKDKTSHIEVSGETERQAVFFLKDGTSETKRWVKPPKRGVKHTEEWKQNMRKYWSDRRRNEHGNS